MLLHSLPIGFEHEHRFAEHRFAEHRFAEHRFAEHRFAESKMRSSPDEAIAEASCFANLIGTGHHNSTVTKQGQAVNVIGM